MSKHTKGEWIADGSFVYCLNNHREKSNRFNLSICKGYDDNKKWMSDEEAEANARLIAAAPDLLDALKMVLDDPEALQGRPRTYECVMEAITKAEGGE